MGDKIRDKEDGNSRRSPEEIKTDLNVPSVQGCPTCGNEDIQSAELLEAWKKNEDLEKQLAQAQLPVSSQDFLADPNLKQINPLNPDWKVRYEKIKAEYIRTRLEVSGSFGNWDYNTRKRVLENEISAELGFKV